MSLQFGSKFEVGLQNLEKRSCSCALCLGKAAVSNDRYPERAIAFPCDRKRSGNTTHHTDPTYAFFLTTGQTIKSNCSSQGVHSLVVVRIQYVSPTLEPWQHKGFKEMIENEFSKS